MPSVLIVDDLLSIHEMLEAVIQPTGYGTSFATDGEKALARYKSEKHDLVLADIDMKPMDGITLLRQLKAYDHNAVVIIMTAYASTDSAVQALKYGAFDYLQKPFRVDELIKTLKRAMEYRKFCTERPDQASVAAGGATAGSVVGRDLERALVGASAAHKKLVAQIRKLSAVRTPVLLQGEAGTGKTTMAELLHAGSAAPDATLVRIDCAKSSDPDFHPCLIGPSGTGGEWISGAKGGTLLIQQIEKLPLDMQRELVGVLRANAHAFRTICTSDVDLERQTEEGLFDDELFYRVASLPVEIPPLRERPEDITPLVKFFCSGVVNPNLDSSLIDFDSEAIAVLKSYPWPGNITDLGQVVTRIASTTETRLVSVEQLPMRIKDMNGWPNLAEYLARQEKHYIEQVLKACRGDKNQASKVLQVDLARIG